MNRLNWMIALCLFLGLHLSVFADEAADVASDQKVVEEINTALISADETLITRYHAEKKADAIKDEGKRKLMGETVYIALNYLNTQESCMSRSMWFMLYGSVAFFAEDPVCVKRVKDTIGNVKGAQETYRLALEGCKSPDEAHRQLFTDAQNYLFTLTGAKEKYGCKKP